MPEDGINEKLDLENAMNRLSGAVRNVYAALRAAGFKAPADTPLFAALREWRTGEAREKGLPPYIIATDAQLRAIEAAQPTDLEQLRAVKGLSENKVATYGEAIVHVVSTFETPLAAA
jgi:ATP-dependent DNA helicase RecQ